ncbi:MAG: sigma-70 family RNA polymerase sigma factor [Planctomycetes bacterium]|nr:sigma-70 family RNA polymerase sigma factor [Planctomycetota bacterium]
MPSEPSPLAPLLANADFLRRLASQLAGPQAGDDLAQDSWVAALRSRAAPVHEPRGLWRTIATNLWRNTTRNERRRVRREAAVAPPEDEPSVASIAAQEETRRCVVAAVLELPSPLRQVVLLHFYEGLASPEIGQRLGLSPSGVRTRMQAAIAQLRLRLDDEHGGVRQAWAAPLLAWQRFGTAGDVVATATATATVAGGAANGAWRVAIALCAVLGAVLWWQLRERATPEPAAAQTADAGGGSSAWLASSPGQGGDERTAAAPPQAVAAAIDYTGAVPTGQLAGAVVDYDTGQPIEGAAITVRGVAGGTSAVVPFDVPATGERSARTDAVGQFRVAPLRAGLYEVCAELDDGHSARDRVAVGAGDARLELFVCERPQLGAIAVKVLDAQGRGVGDAEVELHLVCTRRGAIGFGGVAPIVGRSDVTGCFAMRDPERLEHVFEGLVVARCADGRVGCKAISRPEHRGVNPYVAVVVAAPGHIAGRLAGVAGRDLAAARVVAQALWTYDHVRPDAVEFEVAVAADGAFAIELPAGRYHLAVRGVAGMLRELAAPVDNWQFLPVVEVAAGETADVELMMVEAAAVRGVVRDAEDRTVAGAIVELRWRTEPGTRYWHPAQHGDSDDGIAEPYTEARATTDAAGRYELFVRPGLWDLAVAAPGHSIDVQPAVQVDAKGRELEHRLTVDGALRGRSSVGALALQPEHGGVVQSLSTNHGWFGLRGLSPGRWQVGTVSSGRLMPITTVAIAAGAATFVDLDELSRTWVRGAITYDGAPVAGLEVRASGSVGVVTTGADGSFAVRYLRDGRDALTIAHRGLMVQRVDLSGRGDGDIDLGPIELQGRRLQVRGVDQNGAPVAALLEVMNADGDSSRVQRRCELGVLDAQWVPRSAWSLWARARFADGAEAERRVRDDEQVVELVHRPAGTLRVRVLDADGAPRAGAVLAIEAWGQDGPAPRDGATFHGRRDRGAGRWTKTTDPAGVFELRGVTAGAALVYFYGPWGQFGYDRRATGPAQAPPVEVVVDVVVGQPTAIDLVLPR